jgi:hypothetical protein
MEIELRRIVLPSNFNDRRHFGIREMLEAIGDATPFSAAEFNHIRELQTVRNAVAHAMPSPIPLTPALVKKVESYANRLRKFGKE